jgi:uncharacterized protein with FMN-binding domain
MRKTFVIIFAVAILGGLSFYVNKSNANDQISSTSTTADSTSSNSSDLSASKNSNSSATGAYKNGTYSGTTAETPYGAVQVAAVISGGKITDIEFLKMPSEEDRSRQITKMAIPLLKESTLNRQSARKLDMVTGATSTYYGYQESLQAALDKAS